MFRKKPRLVTWLFTTWVAMTVGLPALLVVTASALRAPSGEVASWAVLGFVVGLTTGWLVGLLAWVVVNGLYSWGVIGRFVQNAREEAKEQAALEEEARREIAMQEGDLAGVDPSAATANPWMTTSPNGESENMNPWGCCKAHYDEDGYAIHGAPGCKHPDAFAEPFRD